MSFSIIARGQDSPVRGELEAIDGARVRLQRDESLAGVDVPELERAAGDGEDVPRERDGADRPLVGDQPVGGASAEGSQRRTIPSASAEARRSPSARAARAVTAAWPDSGLRIRSIRPLAVSRSEIVPSPAPKATSRPWETKTGPDVAGAPAAGPSEVVSQAGVATTVIRSPACDRSRLHTRTRPATPVPPGCGRPG